MVQPAAEDDLAATAARPRRRQTTLARFGGKARRGSARHSITAGRCGFLAVQTRRTGGAGWGDENVKQWPNTDRLYNASTALKLTRC